MGGPMGELPVPSLTKYGSGFLYSSSPNLIQVIESRRMRGVGYVASVGDRRGAHRVLVGRPDGKRPLGRPRLRLENNIKI
jgi:hypothetical protein